MVQNSIKGITKKLWGYYEGKEIYLFRIEAMNGTYVELTNYGAIIVSITVPDRVCELKNVVLGFNNLEGYLKDDCYIGATIGRFANRIKNARFYLHEQYYTLESNDQGNCNHGGSSGFHKKVFDADILDNKIVFSLFSPDKEGGFPGNIQTKIIYSWDTNCTLSIDYYAGTDMATPINISNHTYFNLSGGRDDIKDNQLTIHALAQLQYENNYLPTGKILPFNKQTSRSALLVNSSSPDAQLKCLNQCYVLDKTEDIAAILYDHNSGRRLSIYTSYPGLLVYTGDQLHTTSTGHFGKPYQPNDGICLECQFYPDSPNIATFPSTILQKDQAYHHQIQFRFDIQKG